MLQRLGLADALLKDPAVLILDEPTTSIDPVGVAETLDLVRELAHDQRRVRAALEPPSPPGPADLRPDRDLRRRVRSWRWAPSPSLPDASDPARRSRSRSARTAIPNAVAATLRAVPGVSEVVRDSYDRRALGRDRPAGSARPRGAGACRGRTDPMAARTTVAWTSTRSTSATSRSPRLPRERWGAAGA